MSTANQFQENKMTDWKHTEYSDKPMPIEFDNIAGIVYRRKNIRQIEREDMDEQIRLVWVADEQILPLRDFQSEEWINRSEVEAKQAASDEALLALDSDVCTCLDWIDSHPDPNPAEEEQAAGGEE